jgi:DNA modification methylase
VFDGICVDGMHRLGIVKKHNLPYKIKQLQFQTKEEAKVWVFEHQNGRRNQSIFGKIKAGLQFEDYYRDLAKTNQRQSPGRGQKGRPKMVTKINTLNIIAQKIGVARGYVAYVKYILDNANAETIEKCYQGDLSIKNAYLKAQDQARRKRRQTTADANITFQNPQGEYINQIICGDCIDVMKKMVKSGLAGKVSLIVFSPNYNNNCNYGNKHNDYISYKKHIDFLGKVFYECYKLLRKGGRLVCQIDSMTNTLEEDKGDAYKHAIYPDLVQKVRELNNNHNFKLNFFTEICWYKYNGAGKKSAHGSYSSCSCPVIKRTHEYLLIWSKEQWQLPCIEGLESDITPEEFDKYIWSVWDVHPITQSGLDHPCTYPPKLMERVIKLFSYPNDIVLDPFNGSGTTTAVAKQLKRRFVGIDQNPNYCDYAQKRTL